MDGVPANVGRLLRRVPDYDSGYHDENPFDGAYIIPLVRQLAAKIRSTYANARRRDPALAARIDQRMYRVWTSGRGYVIQSPLSQEWQASTNQLIASVRPNGDGGEYALNNLSSELAQLAKF